MVHMGSNIAQKKTILLSFLKEKWTKTHFLAGYSLLLWAGTDSKHEAKRLPFFAQI